MRGTGVGALAAVVVLTLSAGSPAAAQSNFWTFGERTIPMGMTPSGDSFLYRSADDQLIRWHAATQTGEVAWPSIPFFGPDCVSADLGSMVGHMPFGSLSSAPTRWRPATGYQQLMQAYGWATAVSGDGQAVTGTLIRERGAHAFRWTAATGGTLLADLPAANVVASEANQISRDGSTIAGFNAVVTGNLYTQVPTVWRNGTPQALSYPPEASLASIHRLSADGQRAVGANFRSDPGLPPVIARMLFWDAANQYEIINLPDGWRNIEILGGTADLSTVVGTLISASENRGFLWRRDLGFVLADDLLATIGVTRPDWEFNDIRSISDDGRTIVGTARLVIGNPFQEEIAWVATIPTPGAAALLTLAGLWTARRRRGAAGTPNQSPEA